MTLSWFRSLIVEWLSRVRHAWLWIVLEVAGVALLIAAGMMWTRIPEKHWWQVLLTLLVPLLLAAAFVVLQAGTFRGFLRPATDASEQSRPRVSLYWGAATLVIWLAIGWVLWAVLDKFDDHTFNWALYLNSKAGPQARVHWASYEHLNRDLEWAGWTLRWVIVPGLLMPFAASAAWGLRRLPWLRVLRLYVTWHWWPAVLALALVGEAWPQTWFEGEPHGSVQSQVMRVIWKLAAAYLLAMVCWVKFVGWTAMQLDEPRGGDDGGEPEPSIAGPRGEKHATVKLSLPDANEGVGGNA